MKGSCAIAIILGLLAVVVAFKKPSTECTFHGEMLANPYDCGTFFECSHGVMYMFRCPAGLHFHPVKKICDYPSETNCQPARTREVPKCPENPGNDVIHLPNPDDCSSFYKCNDKNEPVLIPCPPGLEFNPILLVCDFPAQANCTVSRH